tara:strand:+ start:264 stop:443 length:180 start_codon:yes stop_codon:yes gene_type:complete
MHLMAQLIRRERLRQVEHDCLEGGPIIGMDPFDQGAMCKFLGDQAKLARKRLIHAQDFA